MSTQQPTNDVRRRDSQICFSLKSIGSKKLFNHYSAVVQQIYTIPEIHSMWNWLQMGNQCKETTIKRWLQPGPNEKNPNFEGFIAGLFAQSWLKIKKFNKEQLIHEKGADEQSENSPTFIEYDFENGEEISREIKIHTVDAAIALTGSATKLAEYVYAHRPQDKQYIKFEGVLRQMTYRLDSVHKKQPATWIYLICKQLITPIADFHIAFYDVTSDSIRVQLEDCSIIEQRLSKFVSFMQKSHTVGKTSEYVGFSINNVTTLFERQKWSLLGVWLVTDLIEVLLDNYPHTAARQLKTQFSDKVIGLTVKVDLTQSFLKDDRQ